MRFQTSPLLKPFSKVSVFIGVSGRFSVNDRRKRIKKYASLFKRKRTSVDGTLVYLIKPNILDTLQIVNPTPHWTNEPASVIRNSNTNQYLIQFIFLVFIARSIPMLVLYTFEFLSLSASLWSFCGDVRGCSALCLQILLSMPFQGYDR